MKIKYLFAVLAFITGNAFANAYDFYFQQMNAGETDYNYLELRVPSASRHGIFFYNGTTHLPLFATLGTGLAFAGNELSVTTPAQVQTDWNASTGLGVLLNKPVNVSDFSNDANYVTASTLTTSLGGYALTSDLANYVTGASLASTLTNYASTTALTTGLSAKFANPSGTTAQYVRGDGSIATLPTAGTGTVTSIGVTSSNLTVSGSPVTTSGSIAVSLPSVGTAGNYTVVTTDAQGRVTAGTAASQSAATRTLNSAFQVSSTRASLVNYSVRIVTTASIGGNQDGDVILEIASDSGFTTNVQTLSITQNAQAISLAVVLNSVQTQTGVLSGYVPAGYYVRLRTVNNTGAPNFQYRAGQEVLM